MHAPVVVDCRFQRFSCGHDLFQATYTRSNRTRGAKIMRCFPHCCPEHMPRCYCGCSLQVLVTFTNAQTVRHEDIVVCARFETSEMQEPTEVVHVGDALTVPSAILSSNIDDANATSWIVAERESEVKQRQLSPNSVLYVLNNHRFPRWYYGYESGATKNQREMRHHLTTYVLLRHQPDHPRGYAPSQSVSVLGRLASPSFAIISYRRARADVKKPAIPEREDPFAALEERPASFGDEEDGISEEKVALTPTRHVEPTKIQTPDVGSMDESEPVSSGNDSPLSTHSIHEAPRPSLIRDLARKRAIASLAKSNTSHSRNVTDPSEDSEFDHDKTAHVQGHRKRKASVPTPPSSPRHYSVREWWSLHHKTALKIGHLKILVLLLDRLTLQDVDFSLREHTERLRNHWFGMLATLQTDPTRSARLRELADAFCLNMIATEAFKTPATGETKGARSVQACVVALFFQALTSKDLLRVLESTWQQLSVVECVGRPHALRSLFCGIMDQVYDVMAAMGGRSDSHPSITSLVDDVVSMIFTDPQSVPLRREVVKLLRDSSGVAEQWFEIFVAQMRVAVSAKQERTLTSMNSLTLAAPQPSMWKGKWVMDAGSFRLRRSPAWCRLQESGASLLTPLNSVLSTVLLLQQWLAVEVEMEGPALCVRSLLTGSRHPGMRLILDERRRVFKCFPDGISSVVGGGPIETAWFHGDYVGRGNDDGHEIVCEAFSIHRGESTTERVLLQRVFVKASVWSRSDSAKQCTVAVKFATATTHKHQVGHLVTWPVADRHQLYGNSRWTVIADVEATFNDLK